MKQLLLLFSFVIYSLTSTSQTIGSCSQSGGGTVVYNSYSQSGPNTYTLTGRLQSNGTRAIYFTVRCGGWTGNIVAEGPTDCLIVQGTASGEPFSFTFTTTCPPDQQYINIGVATQNQCNVARGNSQLQPCSGILPVELKEFNARKNSNSVSLSWSTSTEKNAKEFVVQKKTNADFTDIATIPASNNVTGGNYSYDDVSLDNGINQYRLKMVDLDGTVKYSSVRVVRGGNAPSFTIYPNPGNSNSKITLNESGEAVNVVIYNANGKVVKTFNSLRETTVSIGNLGAGVYVVKVINSKTGESSSQKLTIN